MAWASKKQYAILMNSEEGKDLAEQLGELSQEEFEKKFGELLGKGGSYSEDDEEKSSDDNYNDYFERREYEKNKNVDNNEEQDDDFDEDDIDFSKFSWLPSSDKNDEDSYQNRLREQRMNYPEFNMPKDEGWEESEFGEKSFIKNKDKDDEMFIQYNGEDFYDTPEYVAGYMKDGDYVTKKFNNFYDAKSFIDTYEINKNKNNDLEKKVNDAISNMKYGFKVNNPNEFNEVRKLLNKRGYDGIYNDFTGYVKIAKIGK